MQDTHRLSPLILGSSCIMFVNSVLDTIYNNAVHGNSQTMAETLQNNTNAARNMAVTPTSCSLHFRTNMADKNLSI